MKLYLAGVESHIEEFNEAQPPYILFSFAACRGAEKTQQKIMDCVTRPWCNDYLLDSGAFTFFTKGRSKTLDEWDRYIDEYIEFINGYNVHHFFELDIDRIVGLEKVEEYRRRIEKRTGKQSIPVWHINRAWAYFERMCDEYEYVSLGGIAKNPNGKTIEKLFPWFIDHAHKKGVRIHGLGYTDTNKFKLYPFDSVDSTTWNVGSRYGNTFEYKNNAMRQVRKEFPDKTIDGPKLNVLNLKVWTQYAKMLDT